MTVIPGQIKLSNRGMITGRAVTTLAYEDAAGSVIVVLSDPALS